MNGDASLSLQNSQSFLFYSTSAARVRVVRDFRERLFYYEVSEFEMRLLVKV